MTLTWLSVGRSGQHFECVGAAIEALLSVYRETRALLTSLAPNHLPSSGSLYVYSTKEFLLFLYLSELNLRAWGSRSIEERHIPPRGIIKMEEHGGGGAGWRRMEGQFLIKQRFVFVHFAPFPPRTSHLNF